MDLERTALEATLLAVRRDPRAREAVDVCCRPLQSGVTKVDSGARYCSAGPVVEEGTSGWPRCSPLVDTSRTVVPDRGQCLASRGEAVMIFRMQILLCCCCCR